MDCGWDRRTFLHGAAAGLGGISAGGLLNDRACAWEVAASGEQHVPVIESRPVQRRPYRGPNVIVIRFGGGVRRRETIDARHTYSPFFCHELIPRGTLLPRMEIASLDGIETSHGQGTLYIITGKYHPYKDVGGKFLGDRFEAVVPTIFEYLRKEFNVPPHETLIVNGEDRIDEEFYTFSNHHLFGVNYRSDVLSLYRFKTHLLRQQLEEGKWKDEELASKRQDLEKMESLDHRVTERVAPSEPILRFWDRWRGYYGETGLVNPRGDRVLTELAVRAIRELRPKLLMVNYQDPDYVHWGNMTHYTRAIAIIDEGIERIVRTVETDDAYRDNTVFVVVPDCGRDSNRFMAVPCQHHFGSRSSHEIFALLFGRGIPKSRRVDRVTDQNSVAATIGQLMGFRAEHAEGAVLEQAIA